MTDAASAPAQRRVLVADDDEGIRSMMEWLLKDEGYSVITATRGSEAVQAVQRAHPDIVLLDVRLPDVTGIEVLQKLNSLPGPQPPVIMMTALPTSSVAIEAMQAGAFDYVAKPLDIQDVVLRIERCLDYQQLSREVETLREEVDSRDVKDRIVGNSAPMQEIYKTIGRVSRSSATVLIYGETGTGKELVANAIHYNSTRRYGPLIKVSCAALPETLLESELFGHEKGSFTGAMAQRKGRFELANKGSLMLDEIGEMTLPTQTKLLRVLQERTIERIGSATPIPIDVRIISATNKNLQEEVRAGRFREDLFYRLNVITIHMPPLRERKEDIPLLVDHFLNLHRLNSSAPPARISKEAIERLIEHDWPGNVRELENVIERAVVMAQGGLITTQHLSFSGRRQPAVVDVEARVREGLSLAAILKETERKAIREALTFHRGDPEAAAQTLGIDPAQVAQATLAAAVA